MAEPDAPLPPARAPRTTAPGRMTAHALLLGDRITTAGLERSDVFSTAPLSFRVGENGFVAVFRYGVVVLIGLTPLEEDEVLRALQPRIAGALPPPYEEEALTLVVAPVAEEGVAPDGLVQVRAAAPEQLLVIADVLAKSTALAQDERQVAAVFDTVEPFARDLAADGRAPGGRRSMLQLIGSALLVRARVSGRVAAHEKPDVLWDRPDLGRLYARLEDEYEVIERAEALGNKLQVIGETATALTDLIDTQRSLRLEIIIVALILAELVVGLSQLLVGR